MRSSRAAGAANGRKGRSSPASYTVATCALALAASSAVGQSWRFSSSIGVEETYTNNVNLDSSGSRRSDLVSQITPGFVVTEKGAHTALFARVAIPVVVHARTGNANSTVQPSVSLVGNVEAVERFFFIDGAVNVSQQYLSPFGPRSSSLANSTDNRFTSASYRLSPYIKGASGNDLTYELRDSVTWTSGYGDRDLTSNSTTNALTGNITRTARPFGWSAEIDRTETSFANQSGDLTTELARLRGIYQYDPQLQLSVRGGYEHNDYTVETFSNVIYGVGVNWRPTDRTTVDGFWEHRFFGSSYRFDFRHRTPLSVWSVSASRSTTTYPQQLGSLSPGVDVEAILNQLFLTRVPDPTQRQAIVDQFILDRGLPATLSSPITLFTDKITLQESVIGTFGLLGARNSVFFSAYRQHNEPIAGPDNSALADLLILQNNTQYGGGVTWSHSLAPLLTLTAALDGSRTVATGSSRGATRQATARASISTPLSPNTSVFAGLRYQVSRSDVAADFDEAAVFAGLFHQFR